jgi:gamma-glutamylcyclotransferase (GGCT)/AIG2-like uncharacterized protein YtfP
MSHRVFVYGTLKKGNSIRGLDRFGNAELVDRAVTAESTYSLYDLGAFPAVSLAGHNKIQGEVWNVDDETFAVLDQIEGYPDFYHRIKIATTAGTAWIYYIPDVHEYQGATQIAGGKEQTVSWDT